MSEVLIHELTYRGRELQKMEGRWLDGNLMLDAAMKLSEQSAQQGWKLVPVEPTDKMVQAAYRLDLSYMPGQEGADRAAVYRAMLAAAPAPQAEQPAQEPVCDDEVCVDCGMEHCECGEKDD